MSTFSNYAEVPEVHPEVKDAERASSYDKKIAKRLKKQNKALKRLVRLEEQRMVEAPSSKQSSNDPSFWEKIGNSLIKATPSVLTAVATAGVTGILRQRKDSKAGEK